MLLINGAQWCNVFWQVGSSATVGTGTSFVGTIMADQSVTLQTGATVQGRALASIGAVTLDTNVFTRPECATADDDDGDDDDGDDDGDDDDTPRPNPGPRDGQGTQPNPSGPRGGDNTGDDNTNTTDDNTTTDDDTTTDDLVTTTDSGTGTAPPVVPSGNPDTGLGGAGGNGSSAGWLAAGLLAFGGAAAAGLYGYRPLRPARLRRR